MLNGLEAMPVAFVDVYQLTLGRTDQYHVYIPRYCDIVLTYKPKVDDE